MATMRLLISKPISLQCFGHYSPLFSQVRFSMYAPIYKEPIAKKTELQKLEEEGRLIDLKYVPIKAAPNNVSSSVFNDPVINKFTNIVMECGKKKLARSLVEQAFANVKRIQLAKYHEADESKKSAIECNPRIIFHQAVRNCTPVMILTGVKRGGIKYQVPVTVSEKRAEFIAMKWLIEAANDKDRKIHFPQSLAQELVQAFYNEGRAVKSKQNLHKQCEANKAFAHYRWS